MAQCGLRYSYSVDCLTCCASWVKSCVVSIAIDLTVFEEVSFDRVGPNSLRWRHLQSSQTALFFWRRFRIFPSRVSHFPVSDSHQLTLHLETLCSFCILSINCVKRPFQFFHLFQTQIYRIPFFWHNWSDICLFVKSGYSIDSTSKKRPSVDGFVGRWRSYSNSLFMDSSNVIHLISLCLFAQRLSKLDLHKLRKSFKRTPTWCTRITDYFEHRENRDEKFIKNSLLFFPGRQKTLRSNCVWSVEASTSRAAHLMDALA